MNKVILCGNIGKDAELRHTQTGKSVVTFSVATSKSFKNEAGQKQEQTQWHNIVYWTKVEAMASWLKKGRKVLIEGELQTRSWDDKNSGQKRYATEVIVHFLQFLDKAETPSSSNGAASFEPPSFNESAFTSPMSMDDIPF